MVTRASCAGNVNPQLYTLTQLRQSRSFNFVTVEKLYVRLRAYIWPFLGRTSLSPSGTIVDSLGLQYCIHKQISINLYSSLSTEQPLRSSVEIFNCSLNLTTESNWDLQSHRRSPVYVIETNVLFPCLSHSADRAYLLLQRSYLTG